MENIAEKQKERQPQSRGLLSPESVRRILVVDDNIPSAQTLGWMLEAWGHEVRLAHDGPEALLQAKIFPPDIVLLDIGMPGMSGYEVCRTLRRDPSLKNITIVAQTGWGQKSDRQKSSEAGFDHHLVKPVCAVTLKKIIEAPFPASISEETPLPPALQFGMDREFMHAVRNPLNAIAGLSGILAADASLGPYQKEVATVLKTSVEDLKRVIEGAFGMLPEPVMPAGQKQAENAAGNKTVLLVDDYPPNVLMMSDYLKALGYRFDVAQTGLEAVQKQAAGRFDIILLDIQLPDIDGIEVTQKIRAAEKEQSLAPATIISISGMREERDSFLRFGINDCLFKPIEQEDLKIKLEASASAIQQK